MGHPEYNSSSSSASGVASRLRGPSGTSGFFPGAVLVDHTPPRVPGPRLTPEAQRVLAHLPAEQDLPPFPPRRKIDHPRSQVLDPRPAGADLVQPLMELFQQSEVRGLDRLLGRSVPGLCGRTGWLGLLRRCGRFIGRRLAADQEQHAHHQQQRATTTFCQPGRFHHDGLPRTIWRKTRSNRRPTGHQPCRIPGWGQTIQGYSLLHVDF